MVDTVGIPFVKDKYFIPASKSILASVDAKDKVLTLIKWLTGGAKNAGRTVFTLCTVAAAFVT